MRHPTSFVLLLSLVASCGPNGGATPPATEEAQDAPTQDDVTPDDGPQTPPTVPESPYAGLAGVALAKAILEDVAPKRTSEFCAPDSYDCMRVYAFDERRHMIAEQWRGPNKVFLTSFFSYDEQGRLTERLNTAEIDLGSPEFTPAPEYVERQRITYTYASEWRRAKVITQALYDASHSEVSYTWSGNTATIETKSWDKNGNLTTDAPKTVTYDAAGNLVAPYLVYEDGLLVDNHNGWHAHFVYNLERNLVRREIDYANPQPDGVVDEVTSFIYENLDFTGDRGIDATVTYFVHEEPMAAPVGSQDTSLSSRSDTESSGGLDWNYDSSGNCSNCGNMQGQINKIILGY